MSELIIPEEYKDKALVPMQFPFRADGDTILDAEGREVAAISAAIAIKESINLAKLFAAAPEMFEIIGNAYALLIIVAARQEGFEHGTPDEKDKENCILCQCEEVLNKVRSGVLPNE
jgi:hypothetical protein